jgi:hypothetical protein
VKLKKKLNPVERRGPPFFFEHGPPFFIKKKVISFFRSIKILKLSDYISRIFLKKISHINPLTREIESDSTTSRT